MSPDKRILIVEDHPDILEQYKKNVLRAGFVADVASTKEEAFEKVKRRTYHVAMIDVNLTDYSGGDGNDRSGIEIVKFINGLKEGTKCIVISAERGSEVPVDAHKAGIDEYIIKKRIRVPEDYVGAVKKLAAACVIKPHGRFGDLGAYLCFPQERWAWDHQVMQTLKCDAQGLARIMNEVFGPYLPVLRRTNASYSLASTEPDQLTGAFWSKSIGGAIWVTIGRKGAALAEPKHPFTKGELLSGRKKGAPLFEVWSVDGLSRDEFIRFADDLG